MKNLLPVTGWEKLSESGLLELTSVSPSVGLDFRLNYGKLSISTTVTQSQCVLYPYTAERRDVLGCTSPTTKRFPEAREMSRGRSPRDILRAKGNLEVGGDVQPNISWLEAVCGHTLIINPYQGIYQEIHPCRAVSIGRVKINTSLLMMRECVIPMVPP